MNRRTPALLVPGLLLAAASLLPYAAEARPVQPRPGIVRPAAFQPAASPATKLKHIVIIMQENRSMDNLFNGFCVNATICANTVTTDPVTGTPLVAESLAAPFDPFHTRASFVIEYDNGKMDGFSKDVMVCNGGVKPCPYSAFSYVPSSETTIYQELATEDGILSDMTFQTDQTSTFPSHYYAIAGQSGGYVSSGSLPHDSVDSGSGSCKTNTPVMTLEMGVAYPGHKGPNTVSCQDFQTILDLLANKSHTWRYYADSDAGFFAAPEAIKHLYGSSNFIVPSSQFLTDVANGTLADVTYVMPKSEAVSDHPGNVTNPAAGPDWVASLVNAVGETPFWNNTAIVLWWDDWGGWFDHVTPTLLSTDLKWMGKPDPFEYGFRVPLIVISPYARRNDIDHTERTFVGAIRLIEETFKTGSLKTTDQFEPDGLDSMFDFTQKPIPYVPVGGSPTRPFVGLR